MPVLQKIDRSEGACVRCHTHVEGRKIEGFQHLITGHSFSRQIEPVLELSDIFRAQCFGCVGQAADDFRFHYGRSGDYWRRWRGRRRWMLLGGTAREAAGNQK